MIKVDALTLTYKNGKGIFDVSFNVKEGQVVGCLGPNGAGKTTCIRALLGFMKQNSGTVKINHLDAYLKAPEIMKFVGYLPGEISYPDGLTGAEFLQYINEMRANKDKALMYKLIDMFELDISGEIKKFSKGMKQKLGIVVAFMHNPKVLILDEPTSGLDPLMQNKFLQLVKDEKARGKTIFMSTHIFEEVERTCDKVLIIKQGRIVAKAGVNELKLKQRKAFIVQPAKMTELKKLGFKLGKATDSGVQVIVSGDEIDAFIKKLATIKIINLEEKQQSLEDIFLTYYSKGESK